MKKSIALFLIVWASKTFATPAEVAFKAGQFAEAAMLARATCDTQIDLQKRIRATAEAIALIKKEAADACALSARATLTVAAYQTNDRAKAESLIEGALADTQKALGQIPNHVEGTLQSAVALGYRAKLNQSPGIAKEAKKYMERAIVLAPNNAFASLALAGWNGEAVADIGSFIAGTVLGAKKETAYKYYEQALKLDAASPTVPVLYAFNIYRLDAKKHTVRVTQLLTSAVNLKPRDGFEVLNITHARDVLASLAAKDIKRTTALIKRHQPFGAVLKK
jgi:tetratricopeptide (TPR) repeat protein